MCSFCAVTVSVSVSIGPADLLTNKHVHNVTRNDHCHNDRSKASMAEYVSNNEDVSVIKIMICYNYESLIVILS